MLLRPFVFGISMTLLAETVVDKKQDQHNHKEPIYPIQRINELPYNISAATGSTQADISGRARIVTQNDPI